MSILFLNIAFASFMTALIIAAIGCAVQIYDLESKIGKIILMIAAFFGIIAAITTIIYIWLEAVFS